MNPKTVQAQHTLPRGGILVPTSAGIIQYGIPPETIKDTISTDQGVPRIFILPRDMFSMAAGISLAELEFPIYYNFFFKHRKIQVICTRSQQDRILAVMQEALFGPATLDYELEFSQGRQTPGYPDLTAEMMTFRTMPINGEIRPMEMDDVVDFSLVSQDVPVTLGQVSVALLDDGSFEIRDQGDVTAVFPPNHSLAPEKEVDFSSGQVFYPPLFGITTLGAGHGFAPDSMTSGMIIWVNRRGILVDPPVHTALELVRMGVPPRILDSIILTHCHADHDAGTLQKIMQEGSITLYTTPTIFNSFLRKSSALTGIPADLMEKAINFVPLSINAPININGGMFQFSYTLHSIPTINIQAGFGGKSLVYSSDTHNDPDFVDKLYDKGVVSRSRQEFLNHFPWHRDIIFHEAGIPPLHTPMSVLAGLPEAIRQKLYLVHVTQEMIPAGSGLDIAPTGLEGTKELTVSPPEFCRPIEILGTYLDQPMFRLLPSEKTMEFLCIVQTRHYKPGEAIIRAGDRGEHLFLIMTGQVEVIQNGTRLTAFSRSDIFGEKCLFSDAPRTASVIAKSDVRLIALHKTDMLAFIRNTPLEATLFHLSSVQDKTLRQRLDRNPVFKSLTPSQKTALFQILVPTAGPGTASTPVIREGEPADTCYFVAQGKVEVMKGNRRVSVMESGALFGTWALFNPEALSPWSFVADPDTLLYQMTIEDLKTFSKNNPGVYLKLYAHEF